MVAYSFKKRFAPAIASDEKRQTIRRDRKRHARRGEEVQLYTGMRTKQCQLIGRRRCLSVDRIAISVAEERVVVSAISAATGADADARHEFPMCFRNGIAFPAKEILDLDAFAVSDGFAGWRSMRLFWADTHPDPKNPVGWFVGVLIRWAPSNNKSVPAFGLDADLDAIGVR